MEYNWKKSSTIHNVGLFYFCAHSIQFFLLHFQGSPPLPAQALAGLEVRLEGKLCNPLRSLPLSLSLGPDNKKHLDPRTRVWERAHPQRGWAQHNAWLGLCVGASGSPACFALSSWLTNAWVLHSLAEWKGRILACNFLPGSGVKGVIFLSSCPLRST